MEAATDKHGKGATTTNNNNKEEGTSTSKDTKSTLTTPNEEGPSTPSRPTTPPLFAHRRPSAPSSFYPFEMPFSTPSPRAPAPAPSTPAAINTTTATITPATSLVTELAARRRNAHGASPGESSWAGRVGAVVVSHGHGHGHGHASGPEIIVEAAGLGWEKREEVEREGVRVRDFCFE